MIRGVATTTGHPTVSVIINTLDRAASLERTLASLRQLRYPNFEVIVVQGPCSDRTDEVLARFQDRIRIGRCTEANLAMSRNIGLRMATGQIVAFLDDDAIPEPDWLDNLIKGFSDTKVAAVGGFIRDHGGVNYQHQVVIANQFAEVRLCAPPSIPRTPDEYISPTGTNVAVRRDILMEIGGFDEQYAYYLEETDVNLRLHERGWGIVLNSDAEVHHKFLANRVRFANRTPRSQYLIARSKAYFSWTHGRPRKIDREIRVHVESYRAREKRRVRWLSLLGRISRSDRRKLIDEIDRGVSDGTDVALRPEGRRLLSATDARVAPAREFLPFNACGALGGRMRICFLTRTDPRTARDDATSSVYAAARAVAERGHEVTLLCSGDKRTSSIDFVAGIWLHRIGKESPSMLRISRSSAGLTQLGAAAQREINRIQARRRLQAIVGLRESVAALPGHSELKLPVAAIQFGDECGHAGVHRANADEWGDGRVPIIMLGVGGSDTWIDKIEHELARLIAAGEAPHKAN